MSQETLLFVSTDGQEERLRLFQSLSALASAVTGDLSPEEVAQRAAAHLRPLVGTEAVTLYLWDEATAALRAIHVQGQEEIPTGVLVAAGTSEAGRAFERAEPVVIENFAAWEGATTALIEAGVVAAAAVPLFVDGRPVGAVGMKFLQPPVALPAQVEGLCLFAAMVAPVLEAARARAEIRRHEEHYQSLLEGAADGIGIIDSNGRIVEANALLCEMLGYTHHEMIELGVRDIIAASEFSERPLGPESLKSGWSSRSERVLVRKDGSQFPSEVSSVRLPHGSLQSIYRDITRRKATEARIALLAAIVESSDDAIVATNLETNIISWNAGAEALFGYAPEEVIGHGIALLIPPDDQVVLTSTPGALQRGERVILTQVRRRRRDGSDVFVSATVSPVKDAAGSVVGRAAIYRDITEQRQATESLHASEARFRAIWDTAQDGMLMVSPEGPILSSNHRFEELFPSGNGSLVGHGFETLRELLHRASGGVEVPLGTPGREEETHPSVFLLEQQWPTRRDIQVFSTSVSASSRQYLGQLYVFRDVTREHEVDRMKTEFVSLVSHELRTPLTSIKGYVDLLLEDEVGDVPQEQRDFLQIIKNNADRLVTLIGDLLDVSRIEAGKVDLKRESVDVGLSLAFVVESLRPQVEGRNQRIFLELAPHLPLITADADRLTQIFFNLLSNAYKYTPKGGEIHVRALSVDGSLRVEVKDTGVGMNESELAQLFQKFFRAKNRATEEAMGTGLGLAITRSLVEMHGGTISVSSTPGEGSTFAVDLPLTGELAANKDLALLWGASLPRAGGTILVVDDEPDIAVLIRRYLERGGYEVLIARDGNSALRLASERRVDLITLDIQLPDTDGFTVLEWLKSNPDTAQIPVVLLSALPDEGGTRRLGAVDYLAKPVEERLLTQRVAQILAESRGPILVAEDDPDVRGLIVGHLTRSGYAVLEAANGLEAFETAYSEQPKLILMDVRMPQLDGIQALRQLRSTDATRDIPVVMMSASPGVLESKRELLETLGSTLVPKPVSAQAVADALVEGLDHGSPAARRKQSESTASASEAPPEV